MIRSVEPRDRFFHFPDIQIAGVESLRKLIQKRPGG